MSVNTSIWPIGNSVTLFNIMATLKHFLFGIVWPSILHYTRLQPKWFGTFNFNSFLSTCFSFRDLWNTFHNKRQTTIVHFQRIFSLFINSVCPVSAFLVWSIEYLVPKSLLVCLAQSFFSVTHICQTFLFGRLKPALEGLGGETGELSEQAVRQHFRESFVICEERCVIVFILFQVNGDPGRLLIIGQTLNQKTTSSTQLAGCSNWYSLRFYNQPGLGLL